MIGPVRHRLWPSRSTAAPDTPVIVREHAALVIEDLFGLQWSWRGQPPRASHRRTQEFSCIYFAQSAQGHFKIGYSVRPRERVQALNMAPQVVDRLKRVGLCTDLELRLLISPGYAADEGDVHALLKRDALGAECFRGPDVDRLVAGLLAFSAPAESFCHWPMLRRAKPAHCMKCGGYGHMTRTCGGYFQRRAEELLAQVGA